MKSQHRLNSRQIAEQQARAEQRVNNAPLEFASPEELLRHDALHTPVPPRVAFRLEKSMGRAPAQRRPWWRRWFGQ